MMTILTVLACLLAIFLMSLGAWVCLDALERHLLQYRVNRMRRKFDYIAGQIGPPETAPDKLESFLPSAEDCDIDQLVADLDNEFYNQPGRQRRL